MVPLQKVRTWFEGACVLDLFCGVGSSLVHWDKCLGVDAGGEEVRCAKLNAPHALVLQGEILQRLAQIDPWVEASHCEEVYLNPPRGGLGKELCHWLNVQAFQKIAILSCNPRSLVHDLSQLTSYETLEVQAFDFVPHTPHVEVLTLLQRRAEG